MFSGVTRGLNDHGALHLHCVIEIIDKEKFLPAVFVDDLLFRAVGPLVDYELVALADLVPPVKLKFVIAQVIDADIPSVTPLQTPPLHVVEGQNERPA